MAAEKERLIQRSEQYGKRNGQKEEQKKIIIMQNVKGSVKRSTKRTVIGWGLKPEMKHKNSSISGRPNRKRNTEVETHADQVLSKSLSRRGPLDGVYQPPEPLPRLPWPILAKPVWGKRGSPCAYPEGAVGRGRRPCSLSCSWGRRGFMEALKGTSISAAAMGGRSSKQKKGASGGGRNIGGMGEPRESGDGMGERGREGRRESGNAENKTTEFKAGDRRESKGNRKVRNYTKSNFRKWKKKILVNRQWKQCTYMW